MPSIRIETTRIQYIRIRAVSTPLRELLRELLSPPYFRRRERRAPAQIAPDGNQTADMITAGASTPVIQQRIAGLAGGAAYTFYIWARVASGTREISLAIVNTAYAAYLAGPTQGTSRVILFMAGPPCRRAAGSPESRFCASLPCCE